MKKLLVAIGLFIVLASSVQYVFATTMPVGEINLNQPFNLDQQQQSKLNGYPLYLTYQAIAMPQCFAAPCPGSVINFKIEYPTGYKEFTLSEGQSVSYKGASLVLTKITGTTATLYASTTSLPHSIGSNVRDNNGTVWYITQYYTRKAYPSANVFLSYKFNKWSEVVPASAADLNLPIHDWAYNNYGGWMTPRDGSLLNDNGTIYITKQWMKYGFALESIFAGSVQKGFNYSYSNVYPAGVSYLNTMYPITSTASQHPEGTLVNDNGTLYIMGGGAKYGVPSMAVLDSWGYWFTDAVPANSHDREAYMYRVLQLRTAGQLSVEDVQ